MAESNLYRSWGMDIIGMTNLQEAKLAREAEICYAAMRHGQGFGLLAFQSRRGDGGRHHRKSWRQMPRTRAKWLLRPFVRCRMRANANAGRRWRTRLLTDRKAIPEATKKKLEGWMTITSSLALLGRCLRGEQWSSALLDRAIEEDDGRALLSTVVERLGDLFEPRLVSQRPTSCSLK